MREYRQHIHQLAIVIAACALTFSSVSVSAQSTFGGLLDIAKREAKRAADAAKKKAEAEARKAAENARRKTKEDSVDDIKSTEALDQTASEHPEITGLPTPALVGNDGRWLTVPGPAPENRPSCVQFRVSEHKIEQNDVTLRLEAKNNCAYVVEVMPIYYSRFLPNPKRDPLAQRDYFTGGRRFVEPGQIGEMVPMGNQIGTSRLMRFWISAQKPNEAESYRRKGPAVCYHRNWRVGVPADCGPGFAVPPLDVSQNDRADAAAIPDTEVRRGRVTWRHIPLPKGDGGWLSVRDCIRPADVPKIGPADADHGIRADRADCKGPSESAIYREMIRSSVDLKKWGVHGFWVGMPVKEQPQVKYGPENLWSVVARWSSPGRSRVITEIGFNQRAEPGRVFDYDGTIAELIKRYGNPVQRTEFSNNLRPLEASTTLLFAADPRFPAGAGVGSAMNALRERCVQEIMSRTRTVLPLARGAAGILDIEWFHDRADGVREQCPSVLEDFLQIQEAALEPRLQASVRRNGEVRLIFTYARPLAAYQMGQKEIYAERRAAQSPGTIQLDQ